MSNALDRYKGLIDYLVMNRPCVSVRWVKERGHWPDVPENKPINEFLAGLNEAQKEVLCQLLQQSRDGGIFDALKYIHEETYSGNLKLVTQDGELPIEPFGYAMFEDLIQRWAGGDWWSDTDLKPEYRYLGKSSN